MPYSKNFRAVARCLLIALIALLIPSRHWYRAARAVAPLILLSRHGKLAGKIRHMAVMLNREISPQEGRRTEAEISTHKIASFVRIMGQHFSKGLDPVIRVSGTEHLDAALALENGAILWAFPSRYGTIIGKMGLCQAGYQISQLSRGGHGFGNGDFVQKHLNRFITDIEDRYLKERLTIVRGREMPTFRRMHQRLKENGIVSISLVTEAEQIRMVPCLGGYLRMAAGAPNIAITSGAALLPVQVLRQPDDSFDVTIFSPLTIPDEGGRVEKANTILKEFVGKLEPLIQRHPDQCSPWGDLVEDVGAVESSAVS
jgi:lauroyl/myristoyl acyltransferase